jgi:sugar transferase EpsL
MIRLRDIFASLLGLTILLPLLAVVAIAVRLRLGSPILFCQTRPGLHGKLFMLRKFRTMRASSAGEDLLATDAVRLTRPGRFLRSTSLDELPTLWNVLLGDMSLVGPRPLLPEYLPLYTVQQMRRHEVKPGITGWAQVNGRNAISWEEKFELDVWYVDNRSFLLDLKILCMTVWQVVARRHIAADGHVTMPPFRGATK